MSVVYPWAGASPPSPRPQPTLSSCAQDRPAPPAAQPGRCGLAQPGEWRPSTSFRGPWAPARCSCLQFLLRGGRCGVGWVLGPGRLRPGERGGGGGCVEVNCAPAAPGSPWPLGASLSCLPTPRVQLALTGPPLGAAGSQPEVVGPGQGLQALRPQCSHPWPRGRWPSSLPSEDRKLSRAGRQRSLASVALVCGRSGFL